MCNGPRAGRKQDGSDPNIRHRRATPGDRETREQLGDTVEARAAKTDVKAQAKRKVEETKASVGARKDDVVEKARSVSGSAAESASRVPKKARRNPMRLVVAGALLTGLVIWRIVRR